MGISVLKTQTQHFQVAISQMKWKGMVDNKSPTSTRGKTSRKHSSKSTAHKQGTLWVLGLRCETQAFKPS